MKGDQEKAVSVGSEDELDGETFTNVSTQVDIGPDAPRFNHGGRGVSFAACTKSWLLLQCPWSGCCHHLLGLDCAGVGSPEEKEPWTSLQYLKGHLCSLHMSITRLAGLTCRCFKGRKRIFPKVWNQLAKEKWSGGGCNILAKFSSKHYYILGW